MEQRYVSRAWGLLTHDKGWLKPVLVLAAALLASGALAVFVNLLVAVPAIQSGSTAMALLLVPVMLVTLVPSALTALVVSGYALEWARLVAWGVDAAPKQRGVRVGECLKSGWRGLLAVIGYAFAFAAAQAILSGIFSGGLLSGVVTLALWLASAFMTIVYLVVQLRAAIYQRVGAAYRIGRIWEMVRRDTMGLVRIAALMLLIEVAVGVGLAIIASITMLPSLMPFFGRVIAVVGYDGVSDTRAVLSLLSAVASLVGPLFAWLVIIVFVGLLAEVALTLIGHTAVALWMRQFDVPLWGGSDDPLPVGGPDAPSPAGDAAPNASAAGPAPAGFSPATSMPHDSVDDHDYFAAPETVSGPQSLPASPPTDVVQASPAGPAAAYVAPTMDLPAPPSTTMSAVPPTKPEMQVGESSDHSMASPLAMGAPASAGLAYADGSWGEPEAVDVSSGLDEAAEPWAQAPSSLDGTSEEVNVEEASAFGVPPEYYGHSD